MNAEYKWIVGDERRFGPCQELVVPIPRHYPEGESYYFRIGVNESVPQSRVFDTPQEAAIAAIAIHDETIRWANVKKQQMLDWLDRLGAERQKQEAERATEAARPPKEVDCPVCHRAIGTVKGRIARHNWWPQGRKSRCGGSGREAVKAAQA